MFRRVVQRRGSVPVLTVVFYLGKFVANGREAVSAVSMFVWYGECGNRRLREVVDQLIVVPIS